MTTPTVQRAWTRFLPWILLALILPVTALWVRAWPFSSSLPPWGDEVTVQLFLSNGTPSGYPSPLLDRITSVVLFTRDPRVTPEPTTSTVLAPDQWTLDEKTGRFQLKVLPAEGLEWGAVIKGVARPPFRVRLAGWSGDEADLFVAVQRRQALNGRDYRLDPDTKTLEISKTIAKPSWNILYYDSQALQWANLNEDRDPQFQPQFFATNESPQETPQDEVEALKGAFLSRWEYDHRSSLESWGLSFDGEGVPTVVRKRTDATATDRRTEAAGVSWVTKDFQGWNPDSVAALVGASVLLPGRLNQETQFIEKGQLTYYVEGGDSRVKVSVDYKPELELPRGVSSASFRLSSWPKGKPLSETSSDPQERLSSLRFGSTDVIDHLTWGLSTASPAPEDGPAVVVSPFHEYTWKGRDGVEWRLSRTNRQSEVFSPEVAAPILSPSNVDVVLAHRALQALLGTELRAP